MLFLLLLTISAWLCLQHSRNLGTIFLPSSVGTKGCIRISYLVIFSMIRERGFCVSVPFSELRHASRVGLVCNESRTLYRCGRPTLRARFVVAVRSDSERQTPRRGEKDEIYDYEGRIWSSNMQAGRAIHTYITLPAQLTV